MKTYRAVAASLCMGLILAAGLARASECSETSARACQQIDIAIYEDDPERLELALDRWEEVCGTTELLWRTRILAAIWAGTYADSLLGDDPVGRMLRYRRWYTGDSLPALAAGDSSLYPVVGADGDSNCAELAEFSIDLAEQLVPYTPDSSEEELFTRFFAGELDRGLRWAQRDSIASPRLLRSHSDWMTRVSAREGDELAASLHLGLWRGVSGLGSAGSQLAVGLSGSAHSGRSAVRVLGELRIGNTKRDYAVRDGDELYDTNAFTGILLGVEPSFTLLRWKSWTVSPAAGLGWYGVESLSAEAENDVEARWIHSLARSVGVDLRYFHRDGSGYFVGLELRHEWNDFDTGRGGDDLAGQSWLLRFALGKRTDPVREAWRRALVAPER